MTRPAPADAGFRAPWWLRGPHAQTLWATLARSRAPRPALIRERFELPDGDFVDLDWHGDGDRATVIVLHGLQGSSESPYARGLLDALHRHGWRGVVLNFRGCSGEPNRLDRGYHSGDTGDLDRLVARLATESDAPLAAVGFSLGGNVLLRWLAERGAQAALAAAVAVSAPFDLAVASERLDHGFARLYRAHLLATLRRDLRRKYATRRCPFDLEAACRERDFRGFDDRVTAPLHGFSSADDYYRRASCRPVLGAIATPTLILHARDDPFMRPAAVPGPDELSPATCLELSDTGGHVGFVAGGHPFAPVYWLEHRIPAYLAVHLEPGTAIATRAPAARRADASAAR